MSPRARPAGCCAPTALRRLPRAECEALVATFKALADPTRLELFRLVAAQPHPVCVCDLVDRFDLSQPTISHHLRVLREAGLLEMAKVGVWAFYSATPDAQERLTGAAALGTVNLGLS